MTDWKKEVEAARATGRRINLRGAKLRGANLVGADLHGANLTDADLRKADLRGANLTGANLVGANLHGANLGGANLGSANLREANLTGAYLRKANLFAANLAGAKLRKANLGGANLRNANLFDANLHGAFLGSKNANGCKRVDREKKGGDSILRFKILITLALVILGGLFLQQSVAFRAVYEASVAVKQLEDNAMTYAISRWISGGGLTSLFTGLLILILAAVWLSEILNGIQSLLRRLLQKTEVDGEEEKDEKSTVVGCDCGSSGVDDGLPAPGEGGPDCRNRDI